MTPEELKKVKGFTKKHYISLGITGVGMMLVNLWLADKMSYDPFTHFIVMAFLINGIVGVAYARIYHTLTKDRGNASTKKDS